MATGDLHQSYPLLTLRPSQPAANWFVCQSVVERVEWVSVTVFLKVIIIMDLSDQILPELDNDREKERSARISPRVCVLAA